MKVYLDDERSTPVGWQRTYTVGETIALLETRQVTHVSLDNDLGDGCEEGWNVAAWIEETVYNDPAFPIPEMTIHSANPVRAANMRQTIESINRIRQQQEQQGE